MADTALGVNNTARWASFAHSGENVQPGRGAPIGPENSLWVPVGSAVAGRAAPPTPPRHRPFLISGRVIVHASTDVGELYWVEALAVVLQGPVGVALGPVLVG